MTNRNEQEFFHVRSNQRITANIEDLRNPLQKMISLLLHSQQECIKKIARCMNSEFIRCSLVVGPSFVVLIV